MKRILLALMLLVTPAAFGQKGDPSHFWMSAWVLAQNQCLAEKGSFSSEKAASFNLREAIKKFGYEYSDADNPYIIAFASELRNRPNSLREYCIFPKPSEDQIIIWYMKYYRDDWGLGF